LLYIIDGQTLKVTFIGGLRLSDFAFFFENLTKLDQSLIQFVKKSNLVIRVVSYAFEVARRILLKPEANVQFVRLLHHGDAQVGKGEAEQGITLI
jgi:hypothetical protein